MKEEKKAVVTLCDRAYFDKARRTILDIRSQGYTGDLVLICIGFLPSMDFLRFYKVRSIEFPQMDVSMIVRYIKEHPFQNTDGREVHKTAQWNKLYVFKPIFTQWDYILFVDAGLRVFTCLDAFFNQKRPHSIVALDDSHPEDRKRLECQLEKNEHYTRLVKEYPNVPESRYFLNCLFLFDTSIIEDTAFDELQSLMGNFVCCRTNEMALMNLWFVVMKKQWYPLDIHVHDNSNPSNDPKPSNDTKNRLILFDWSERDGNLWTRYGALKYPTTIGWDI